MSSKRVSGQRQQANAETEEQYDEYVYYPYQAKTTSDGRYEYIPEGDIEYDNQDEQYYETTKAQPETMPTTGKNPAPVQRSTFRHELPNEFGVDKDRVRVIVRVRPLNSRETEANVEPKTALHCENGKSIVVQKGQQIRPFTFDAVFDEGSTQEEVFQYSGIKYLVDMAIEGYTATCFAYGQTGSGKTHTMIGPGGAEIFQSEEKYREKNFGIAPRAINYLFQRLRERSADDPSPYYIRVSYCEIYNEQIRDLINPASTENLQVRGSIEDGFYVENLYQTYIEAIDDLLTILQEGELNRAMAAHNLNDMSSRSHAMLFIQIEQDIRSEDETQEQMTRQGKLIFVDLAGSEKVKVSHSKGKQLVETNNINKSLLTLGTCISALSNPSRRGGHIPYRESKLTRLLADSLGGHGITLMIACISPSTTCESESLSTLRYASRAKFIENAPIVKTDSKENVISRLKLEVRKLKDENYKLKQKLGGQKSDSAPRMKNRNHDGGSQISFQSGETNETYDRLDSRDHPTANTAQNLRNRHETLARENEKLARQLYRQSQQPEIEIVERKPRRVIVVQDPPAREILPRGVHKVIRAYRSEPEEEIVEVVQRPSYANQFRRARGRIVDDGSPQRVIRVNPGSAIVQARR